VAGPRRVLGCQGLSMIRVPGPSAGIRGYCAAVIRPANPSVRYSASAVWQVRAIDRQPPEEARTAVLAPVRMCV
jgi:hypothetical protein